MVIAYLILGIGLLVGLLLLGRWFATADPRMLAKIVRVGLVLIGAAVVVLFLVSGRFALASVLFGGLLPLLMRWRALSRMFKNARGPSPGQRSEVETRFLRMTLDHDTGAMTGVILDGPHRGRHLHELSFDELLEFLRACRIADPESASLLETYLDRTQEADWRAAGAGPETGPPPPADGQMSRDEAYRILGLAPGASDAEIKEAHRKLMQKLHPDRGGPSYLAAKINEAKDFLLGA